MTTDSSKPPKNAETSPPRPVLVPPLFGVGPADKLPLTLNALDALQSSSFFPVLWQHIQVSDPSYRILNDHMQPGFWLNTATSTKSNVSASMVLPVHSAGADGGGLGTNNGSQGGMGRITGERRVSDSWVAQLRGGTHTDPCVVLTHWSWVPGLVFKAATNSLGQAWFSSLLLYSYNGETTNSNSNPSSSSSWSTMPLDVRAVTWIPLDFRNKQTVQDVLSDVPHVNTFGAIKIGGLTGAVESRISTTLGQATDNKFYLSYNLVDDDDDDDDQNTTTTTTTTTINKKLKPPRAKGPPLQFTLQKTNDSTSLALSQVFFFDRFQFNPYEDRANYVRNTVGWTIQMEKITAPSGTTAATTITQSTTTKATTDPATAASTVVLDASSGNSSSITRMALGGAWQVNRSIAIKAVVQPQEQHLDLALILKRWKQPRITCSLLARHDWRLHQTSFLGLGVEVETGSGNLDDYAGGGSSSSSSSGLYAMESPDGGGSGTSN
ncbi:hypothetical protein ACA910_008709 [Epithemia clementina (nom. ined.)]